MTFVVYPTPSKSIGMMRNISVLMVLLLAGGAHAQDVTGAIEGVVTDRTAGAVAGARVTARNADTGFVKEAVAAPDGLYRLLLLPIGQYSVTIEAPRNS